MEVNYQIVEFGMKWCVRSAMACMNSADDLTLR